jgi:hypothetical protein
MATGETFFQVTGAQLDAYRCNGKKAAVTTGGAALIADASSINGATSIQLGNAGAYGAGTVQYRGHENVPLTAANSLVYRVRFNTYPAATTQPMFSSGGPHRTPFNWLGIGINGAGQLAPLGNNEAGQTALSALTYTWSPSTGVWYDVCLTWDGSTSANLVKLYIDAVNVANFTATRAYNPTKYLQAFIALGYGDNTVNTDHRIDEVAWYGSVIDPASVTFRDGTTGTLNGAARTKYLFGTAYEGGAVVSGSTRRYIGNSYFGM